jgi:oligopeptide/dipeptide ABC transporter ATP-binding protein
MALLELEDVTIEYETEAGPLEAVDAVDLTVDSGETLGIVGESGCGKTTVAKSILNILDANGSITGGEIRFDGRDLTELSETELRQQIRWQEISFIPQNAMASLDPVYTVGNQVQQVIRQHTDQSKAEARERTEELFQHVGLDSGRTNDYPHELSGGQRQRVTIALALALEPAVIVADEPTTGLDVVVQDEIMQLLDRIQDELDCAVVFVTHDMSVIAEISDYVVVMYAGRVAEYGTTRDVFKRSAHPYTIGLQNAFPTMRRHPEPGSLISIEGSPPNLLDPPSGCRFLDRCPFSTEVCHHDPGPVEVDEGHRIECHFPEKRETFQERGEDRETWQHVSPDRQENASSD